MYEYLGEAVVLRSEPRQEFNSRVSLFTRRHGKVVGRATSSRKITSKLAGHLQPGNLVRIRAVERGGVQIVDALKIRTLDLAPPTLGSLDRILAELELEPDLWAHLTDGSFSWRTALGILGWDPAEADCRRCRRPPAAFRLRDQEFYCRECALKLGKDEVIYI